MLSTKLSSKMQAALAMVALMLFVTNSWADAHEAVLHNFSDALTDGDYPYAGLVFDGSGNFFGTTMGGGAYGLGTVFELSHQASGGWTEKIIHSFNADGTDGYYPETALILDGAGNLYGGAPVGGANGKGMIYELTPNADGSWTETVLYSFSDSFEPYPSVAILDASGNLYGTTEFGGTKGFGTVFELTPSAGGGWTETVLHTFTGQDGGFPGSLIFDAAGNLYGTSQSGANGHGGIFELKPAAGGAWVEKMIYGFPILGRYGIAPAGLTIDKAGKLYGTTFAGGSSHCNNEGTLGCGTVFELTRNASGKWTETLLYSFSNTGGDGNNPTSAPVFDAAGNLYGITSGGGANSLGAVFELTPAADGSWTETVLHSFSRSGGDGYVPVGGAVLDSAGRVYGATGSGGNGMCKASDGCGTIFEITP